MTEKGGEAALEVTSLRWRESAAYLGHVLVPRLGKHRRMTSLLGGRLRYTASRRSRSIPLRNPRDPAAASPKHASGSRWPVTDAQRSTHLACTIPTACAVEDQEELPEKTRMLCWWDQPGVGLMNRL